MRRRDVIAGLTAAAAWRGEALAQPQLKPGGALPVIGVLAVGGAETLAASPATAIPSALAALGWIDGRNMRLLVRDGNGHLDSLAPLVQELLAIPADVVIARGGTVVARLAASSRTVPIVMSASAIDPVRAGWAESYAKPAGNITGLTLATDEIIEKQLQLLKDSSARVKHVGLIRSRVNTTTRDMATAGQETARTMGLEASIGVIADATDVEPEIDRLRMQGADALLVLADPLIDNFRRAIAEAAIQRRLPTAGQISFYAGAGFLITYAADINAVYRRAVVYVDRILRGERPGDLPIERPSKFVFALNLNTARRMDLIISPTLLSLADEVIE